MERSIDGVDSSEMKSRGRCQDVGFSLDVNVFKKFRLPSEVKFRESGPVN